LDVSKHTALQFVQDKFIRTIFDNMLVICKRCLCLLILIVPACISFAQKRVDQVIPDAEKRKVIKAQKLFNSFRIYEGERILKELIREHPTVAYYHEALVQLQRQVIRQVEPIVRAHSEAENEEGDNQDTEESDVSKPKTVDVPGERKTPFESYGLDPGSRSDKSSKRGKANDEKTTPEDEDADSTDNNMQGFPIRDPEQLKPSAKEKRESKRLAKQLKAIESLAEIPIESYRADFLQNCRKATLLVEHADSASAYLFEFDVKKGRIEQDADEGVSELCAQGFLALREHNPVAARSFFESALQQKPSCYQAHIGMGDTWYAIGKDTLAMNAYYKASRIMPEATEPHEKAATMLYQMGRFEEAAAACIDAIRIYPKQHFMAMLQRIVGKYGKAFETFWIQRPVYPLSTAKNYFEITAKEKNPWWIYQEADAEVHGYFDTLGLVRTNEKTKEPYLEMYAWKKCWMIPEKIRFGLQGLCAKQGCWNVTY
jgi:tetratricopeptide (TPR) repeat protein